MKTSLLPTWIALPMTCFLLAGTPGVQCGQPQAPRPAPTTTDVPATEPAEPGNSGDLPFFGFNAKGTQNPAQQTQYANAFLDQIHSPSIKKDLVIRVTGGTTSQTTYNKDWTPEIINLWVALQQRQGVRFIYVVNGNDDPARQAAVIQRWLDAGAHFDFLEMMNEYYLPKFAQGDRSHAEVTRQVTPETYVNDILPAFWKELDRFHLPYYLIFAPARPGREAADLKMTHWNTVVADAIKNKFPDRDLNATIHLYSATPDLSDVDYDQIDRIRKALPAGRHIAVTEAGIINPSLSYEENGRAAVQHYRNIIRHLRAGDYLLDQVLYNKNLRGNVAALSPSAKGETPKGRLILQFINSRLR